MIGSFCLFSFWYKIGLVFIYHILSAKTVYHKHQNYIWVHLYIIIWYRLGMKQWYNAAATWGRQSVTTTPVVLSI